MSIFIYNKHALSLIHIYINEQWLQMQKDIKENTAEPEIMQELKDNHTDRQKIKT